MTSIYAHAHGLTEYTIDGQTMNAFELMTPTVPFNLTGLPALSMRFGTSHDGMPIAVQVAANAYAESTILLHRLAAGVAEPSPRPAPCPLLTGRERPHAGRASTGAGTARFSKCPAAWDRRRRGSGPTAGCRRPVRST